MTWLKKHGRKLGRWIGIALVLGGLWGAYYWFYKLGPIRHTCDPQWASTHSAAEHWAETQKSLRRGMWFHDDAWTIGAYGDKAWMEWVLKRVKPGTTLDGCLGGDPPHADLALTDISNQDAGPKVDDWLAWWQKNKTKSQEEWIQDGFKMRGFIMDAPPKPEQRPVLLEILGNTETNAATKIQGYMRYNAFRFLRDSGFEPVGYALSNSTASVEIKHGLLQYAKRQRSCPSALGLGILTFGKQGANWRDLARPLMLSLQFQVIAYSLIFVPLLLGGGLIIQSFRKKKCPVIPTV